MKMIQVICYYFARSVIKLFKSFRLFRRRYQFSDDDVIEDCDEFTVALDIGHLALENFERRSSYSAMEFRVLESKV